MFNLLESKEKQQTTLINNIRELIQSPETALAVKEWIEIKINKKMKGSLTLHNWKDENKITESSVMQLPSVYFLFDEIEDARIFLIKSYGNKNLHFRFFKEVDANQIIKYQKNYEVELSYKEIEFFFKDVQNTCLKQLSNLLQQFLYQKLLDNTSIIHFIKLLQEQNSSLSLDELFEAIFQADGFIVKQKSSMINNSKTISYVDSLIKKGPSFLLSEVKKSINIINKNMLSMMDFLILLNLCEQEGVLQKIKRIDFLKKFNSLMMFPGVMGDPDTFWLPFVDSFTLKKPNDFQNFLKNNDDWQTYLRYNNVSLDWRYMQTCFATIPDYIPHETDELDPRLTFMPLESHFLIHIIMYLNSIGRLEELKKQIEMDDNWEKKVLAIPYARRWPVYWIFFQTVSQGQSSEKWIQLLKLFPPEHQLALVHFLLSSPLHLKEEQRYQFLIEAIKINDDILRILPKNLKQDIHFMLKIISDQPSLLLTADEALKNENFLLALININWQCFEYFPEKLKNGKVLFKALEKNIDNFHYIHSDLRNDKKFFMHVLQYFGLVLKFASNDWKKDKEVVLIAIQSNGLSLKYADESFKKDKEVVLIAIQNNGLSLKYADENFKKDKEIVLIAIQNNGLSLKYADESFKKDKEVVLKAIKKNGFSLEYASENLKQDNEVVLIAIEKNPAAIQFAHNDFKQNEEIISEIVEDNGILLKFASNELKKNKGIVEMAVDNDGLALQYADEKLKDDIDIVKTAVGDEGSALQYASKRLQGNKEIIMIAVKNDGLALQFASSDLQNDKEVVIEAIKNNSAACKFSSKELKKDKEIIFKTTTGYLSQKNSFLHIKIFSNKRKSENPEVEPKQKKIKDTELPNKQSDQPKKFGP